MSYSVLSNFYKIMAESENKAAIDLLLHTLNQNPDLWETRKKTAEILYDSEQYLEAADMLWNAPEIPSVDTDVAFAIKIISRARPNRAIRMVYEIVRRNNGKPAKNMAVANALNQIGMYMQASRFYGAALASDPSLFDLGFESQVLWLDDSGKLAEEWEKDDQGFQKPLDVSSQEISGGTISPADIPGGMDGLPPADPVGPASLGRPASTPPPNPQIRHRTDQMGIVNPGVMQTANNGASQISPTTPASAPSPIRPPTAVMNPGGVPVALPSGQLVQGADMGHVSPAQPVNQGAYSDQVVPAPYAAHAVPAPSATQALQAPYVAQIAVAQVPAPPAPTRPLKAMPVKGDVNEVDDSSGVRPVLPATTGKLLTPSAVANPTSPQLKLQ